MGRDGDLRTINFCEFYSLQWSDIKQPHGGVVGTGGFSGPPSTGLGEREKGGDSDNRGRPGLRHPPSTSEATTVGLEPPARLAGSSVWACAFLDRKVCHIRGKNESGGRGTDGDRVHRQKSRRWRLQEKRDLTPGLRPAPCTEHAQSWALLPRGAMHQPPRPSPSSAPHESSRPRPSLRLQPWAIVPSLANPPTAQNASPLWALWAQR